jgi:MFS family permease
MIVMNIVYAVTAYPAGILTDRMSPRALLAMGLAVLLVADVLLAAAASPLPTFIGAALWGLHMGITQGLFAKLVADNAPDELRGTAFGIFNLVGGGALLLASVMAGALWSAIGASATFLSGAAFATLTLIGLIMYRRKPRAT